LTTEFACFDVIIVVDGRVGKKIVRAPVDLFIIIYSDAMTCRFDQVRNVKNI